jgi:hypothetical protein
MSLTMIRTLALGAAASLGAVACSGSASSTTETTSDPSRVATLTDADSTSDAEDEGGDGAGTTDSAEAPDDLELALALYDECMAEFGFAFETSVAGEGDGDGLAVEEQTLELDDPQAQGFDSPEDFDDSFNEANSTCEKHLVNVDSGFDLDPEQQARFEDAQLEWASCMREQGIDIPEIDAGGGGAITIEDDSLESDPQSGGELGAADDFDFDAFDEANEACESAFDGLEDVFGTSEGEG